MTFNIQPGLEQMIYREKTAAMRTSHVQRGHDQLAPECDGARWAVLGWMMTMPEGRYDAGKPGGCEPYETSDDGDDLVFVVQED